jgi:hypothetical protein
MYDIDSPLRRGGSLARPDPQFIVHANHLMGESARNAIDALGNLAALDSLVQKSIMGKLSDLSSAVAGNSEIVAQNKAAEAAYAKQEINAAAFLARAFGNMEGISDYIQDCNYILGSRCKSVIRSAIKNSPNTLVGAAQALGVSQGYLEIAMLRCAYGV